GGTDGFDSQHFVVTSLPAYYTMAKWDYHALVYLEDLAAMTAMDGRRGLWRPSASSGDREVGRYTVSLINCKRAVPHLAPAITDIFVRGFLDAWASRLSMQSRPPSGSWTAGYGHWMFVKAEAGPTLSDGSVMNG